MKLLKEAFGELKNRIGRIPYLYDFIVNHSIDPVVLVDGYSNYYQFLLKMKEDVPTLTEYENKVLTMLSLEVLNGKRKNEIVLLDLLLKKEKVDKDEYVKQLELSNCLTDDETITSVQRIFELEFFSQNSQKKYGEKPILSLQNNKIYMFNDSIRKSLEQNEYFKYMVMDIVRSSKEKGKNYECDSNLTVYKNTQEKMCVNF